jgi:DNA-binding NarL/FixJ family response regulator
MSKARISVCYGVETMNRPRVYIAEDFVLIQEMIRETVEPECDVVAVFEDGREVLDAVLANPPDILLIDASLPAMSGFAVAERALRSHPEVRVVFVTAHSDPKYVNRAFEIGAKAYLLKGSLLLELLPAIRAVLSGEIYKSAILR